MFEIRDKISGLSANKKDMSSEDRDEARRLYEEWSHDLQRFFTKADISSMKCWCWRHNKMCTLFSKDGDGQLTSPKALHVHGAGTPCQDDSKFGAQLHDAGPEQLTFRMWLAERKSRQEHIVIHEITDTFQPHAIHEALSATHQVSSFKLCPTMMGYPVRRLRMLTIAIRHDLVLVAPVRDLLKRMGRRLIMKPGDFFALDTLKNNYDVKYHGIDKQSLLLSRKSAELRCSGDSLETTSRKPWADCLLPSQRQRLTTFVEQVQPDLERKQKLMQGEACIVDLDHDPDRRLRYCPDRVGSVLPTHVSHSCLWHTEKCRPLTSFEVMVSHGCPVIPEVSPANGEAFPLFDLMSSRRLTRPDVFSIAGNSWHIPAIGCLVVWLLSNIEERPKKPKFHKMPDWWPGEDDDPREEEL